jgi:RNA polymerase sigma-70 factor, ECF subfamily
MDSELQRQLPQLVPRLWRFALRLTQNKADAEDLMQRTYVRALERREQWQSGTSLVSWLFAIMHSIWMNELRSAARRRVGSFASEDHEEIELAGNDDQAARSDPEYQMMCKQVVVAVNELPEAQRVVLMLVAVEGLSYKEAAQVLDIPIGTVMSRLARGRLTIGERFIDQHQTEKTSKRVQP